MNSLIGLLVMTFLFTPSGFAKKQKEIPCRFRFAVVEKTESGSENWAVWPEDATQWWKKDGKKFPELCESTREKADFVLTWEKKMHHQEICDTPPVYPDPPTRDYSPPDYDYGPPPQPDYPQQTYPDYSQPPYSPPASSPPNYSPPGTLPPGAGIFCPDCYSPPAGRITVGGIVTVTSTFLTVGGQDSGSTGTGPTGIDRFQPAQAVGYSIYAPANRTRLVSSSSSSDCREVEEERVAVNVYGPAALAGIFGPFKPVLKKEGGGSKPGKAAFRKAMKTLRKKAKKAPIAQTKQSSAGRIGRKVFIQTLEGRNLL